MDKLINVELEQGFLGYCVMKLETTLAKRLFKDAPVKLTVGQILTEAQVQELLDCSELAITII